MSQLYHGEKEEEAEVRMWVSGSLNSPTNKSISVLKGLLITTLMKQ